MGFIATTIFLSALNGSAVVFLSYELLLMYQRGGYRLQEMYRLVGSADLKTAYIISVLGVMCFAFMLPLYTYFKYILPIAYFCVCFVIALGIILRKRKTALKVTKRMFRFCVIFGIAGMLFTLACLSLFGYLFREIAFCALPFCLCFLLPLQITAHFISRPIEQSINNGFIEKTKKKLDGMPSLIKIGITGSFGKTSVKNILRSILAVKYKVCATRANYNTPMGIAITVLEDLKQDDEVLIAEMGARYTYDIRELCSIVKPSIGILSGIGNQHLETFGSMDNLKTAKSELLKSIPKDGFCVINGFNEGAKELSLRISNSKKYVLGGDTEADGRVYFKDIKVSEYGSEFTLVIDGTESRVRTKLLGRHNIINICLAVFVAVCLGLSAEEIAGGIEGIEQIPHRLQLINGADESMLIIDDSYNASVQSADVALEVLSGFKERTKIVITPGIIELGSLQYSINYELGKRIAQKADYCIFLGENSEALKNGLLEGGMSDKSICFAQSLNDGVAKIPKTNGKRVVLFCNDLP